jgi:hypothetical protein
MRCALRCGRIVADATGQSPDAGQRLALEFLAQGARRRSAAIGVTQARQEALALSVLQAETGSGSREW